MIKLNRLFTGLFLSAHLLVQSQIHEMNISTYKPGAPIQLTMYGLFFEDINYGADGGLYAELIKNRSFEFPQSLMGWQTFGKLEVKNDGPFEYNPHYVRLSPSGYPHKWTSLENEGYFGIGVKKGEQYRFSVWTRIPDGKEAVNYQSYGWGFFELFQLAEEIGATPLPVLSYGPACQFQNNDASAHIAPDDLAPYIQDDLELIEFANNTPSTTWGKIQAEMDHPEYLSGNSDYRQFGSEFRRRSIRLSMAGNKTPTSRPGQRTFLQTGKLVFIPK